VRYALVGAEKLREPIAAAFKDKFGITLLEGYGCTEMSPVVAVNAPDVDDHDEHQRGSLAGTVGHPLPRRRRQDRRSRDRRGPADRPGRPAARERPEPDAGLPGRSGRTTEVLRDGWYVTGDIACIDEAGFIRITDRLSRFSKIAARWCRT
jgi:acyl-[acyl-carrier-protein]-phospholipid O-acyltransferase/long-chain-fatty-acid--[acyl-carrier-protein] ligase